MCNKFILVAKVVFVTTPIWNLTRNQFKILASQWYRHTGLMNDIRQVDAFTWRKGQFEFSTAFQFFIKLQSRLAKIGVVIGIHIFSCAIKVTQEIKTSSTTGTINNVSWINHAADF